MSAIPYTSWNPPYGRIQKLPCGYDMHYHDLGTGPAVVFVHGSGPGANAYSNFFANYKEVAAGDSRFIMYSRCGHWAMIERAQDFNRNVIEFLRS